MVGLHEEVSGRSVSRRRVSRAGSTALVPLRYLLPNETRTGRFSMDRPFRIALALIMATFVAHRGYYSRTQPPVQLSLIHI